VREFGGAEPDGGFVDGKAADAALSPEVLERDFPAYVESGERTIRCESS
jgi:hypothetical protein